MATAREPWSPDPVRAVFLAVAGQVGASALLLAGTPTRWAVPAVVLGAAVVASVAVPPLRGQRATPADAVTLTRLALAGTVAAGTVVALAGGGDARSWTLTVLLVPAAALDALDGYVARRTGSSSDHGAELDMQSDAALLLVLSVLAATVVGPWVLLLGLMRYGYAVLARVRPALRAPLPHSQFRRVVAGAQAAALAVALVPAVPAALAAVVLGTALAALTVSFVRDGVGAELAQRARSLPTTSSPALTQAAIPPAR